MPGLLPASVQSLFSSFPLHTHPPALPQRAKQTKAELWVAPPHPTSGPERTLLSADIECLKWQTYLALRLGDQLPQRMKLRFDISPEGGVDGRLPVVCQPPAAPRSSAAASSGQTQRQGKQPLQDSEPPLALLSAMKIPAWVDVQVAHAAAQAARTAEQVTPAPPPQPQPGRDPLAGFASREALDEMNAWVVLLEKDVHMAIVRLSLAVLYYLDC